MVKKLLIALFVAAFCISWFIPQEKTVTLKGKLEYNPNWTKFGILLKPEIFFLSRVLPVIPQGAAFKQFVSIEDYAGKRVRLRGKLRYVPSICKRGSEFVGFFIESVDSIEIIE